MIQGPGILVSADGDFVCDDKCKKAFEAAREDFFNRIVQSEELCGRWLNGEQP
jgi:hypothetical protein